MLLIGQVLYDNDPPVRPSALHFLAAGYGKMLGDLMRHMSWRHSKNEWLGITNDLFVCKIDPVLISGNSRERK
jgi:hypothetical protein